MNTKGIFTREYSGYKVLDLAAPIMNSGGIVVFYHATEHLSMEALQLYGANAVSFHLDLDGHRWFIVGCYLAPDENSTIEDVILAIGQRPRRGALLVAGNLNTNLAASEGRARDKVIAAAMATAGLDDVNGHFLPQRKPWLKDGKTWSMLRRGRELCSRTNYILGTDHLLLQNVTVRYARPNTDHYLVLGCLHIAAPDAHSLYLWKHTGFPSRPPKTPYGVDRLFYEL